MVIVQNLHANSESHCSSRLTYDVDRIQCETQLFIYVHYYAIGLLQSYTV